MLNRSIDFLRLLATRQASKGSLFAEPKLSGHCRMVMSPCHGNHSPTGYANAYPRRLHDPSLMALDHRKTVSASLNRALDTPATEAYRGIHGAETGRINRLVFSIKCFELENRQGATLREFESHRFRQKSVAQGYLSIHSSPHLRHFARNQTPPPWFSSTGSPPSGKGAGPEDSILNLP